MLYEFQAFNKYNEVELEKLENKMDFKSFECFGFGLITIRNMKLQMYHVVSVSHLCSPRMVVELVLLRRMRQW